MATGLNNLEIYKLARELELEIHGLTKNFPQDEKYRSVDQLRRSSSAVTNNLAESYAKHHVKEKIHILRDIAITEAEETKSNLERSAEKGFLPEVIANIISKKYITLIKRTYGYIKFIETDNRKL